MRHSIASSTCLGMIALLGACQSTQPSAPVNPQSTIHRQGSPTPMNTGCLSCGIVQAVDKVKVEGAPSPVGTVGGAIVGGILGSQIGGGNGRTIATVGGALGGALLGRELEKRQGSREEWHVKVRMSNGTERMISLSSDPQLRIGEAVTLD